MVLWCLTLDFRCLCIDACDVWGVILVSLWMCCLLYGSRFSLGGMCCTAFVVC